MKNLIDTELKAEIDAIMKKVKTILKNIEDLDPVKDKATSESQAISNYSTSDHISH